MKAIPTTTMTNPTGVKVNRWKGSRPMDWRWLLTTMLGGVPMRVSIPPRREATETGMRSLEGEISRAHASPMTTGTMTATVPVELMKADRVATRIMMMTMRRTWLSPASLAGRRPMAWATPVWKRPSPTTKRAAIMMTTGSAKPASASTGVRMPVTVRARRARTATTSRRSLSLMNRRTVPTRMP
jgi:hypothetical protein